MDTVKKEANVRPVLEAFLLLHPRTAYAYVVRSYGDLGRLQYNVLS